jgi:tripartite-type tricarboxylate transporter receptor subunit TctC
MKAYASSTIVENRPGAGGRVVMDALKNSAADGSVMVLTPAVAVALYPHVYKSLSYNPQQDFAPVTTICTTSMLIATGPLVPGTVKTLPDFIAWCRSNPNQSSYGSPGAGSPLISSASRCPGLRTLSTFTFPFRERRRPYKVC